MREIKFRGQTPEGEWVYGDLINTVTVTNGIENRHKQIGTDFDFKEVIPETIAQFTGLIDKNGVDIYEGDTLILKSHYFTTRHLYKVIFDNESASFVLLDLVSRMRSRVSEFYEFYVPFKPGDTVCCCLNWHETNKEGNCSYCNRPR